MRYCEAFNEALQAMCEEDGYTFVDCTFLIEGKDGIYEPDGIHVIKSYYPGMAVLSGGYGGIIR